jgi:hypothetical protein
VTARAGAATRPTPSERQTEACAEPGRRIEALYPAIAGAIVLAAALSIIRPYLVGSFQDDGAYVILGRALATGQGYRYLHLPGHPHATHFPPAFPALLAVLWWVAPGFPDNVALFQAANAALLSAAAVGLHEFARRRLHLSSAASLCVALGGTACIPALALTTMVVSEPMFLAALFPVLLSAERAAEGDGPPWSSLSAGALCGGLALIRTIGVLAVPSAVAVAAYRRRYRSALLIAAGALIVLLPWHAWSHAYANEIPPALRGEYGGYSAWLLEPVRRHGLDFVLGAAARNSVALASTVATQFAPGCPGLVELGALLVWLVLLVTGFKQLARRAPTTAGFYASYIVVILLWPFTPFRFFWTVWPLTLPILVLGVSSLREWRPVKYLERAARVASLTSAALLAVGFAVTNVVGAREHYWRNVQETLGPTASAAATWVEQHPGVTDPVISDKEAAVYLYTGHEGLPASAFVAADYVYGRDTARDRANVQDMLLRYPSAASIVVSTPSSIAAAQELARQPQPKLALVDTLSPGLFAFATIRR